VTFSLEGTAVLPPQNPPTIVTPLSVPELQIDETLLEDGEYRYVECGVCHSRDLVSGGMAPDLRASAVVLSKEALVGV
jgi:mono/diheme cytochrome c family protein